MELQDLAFVAVVVETVPRREQSWVWTRLTLKQTQRASFTVFLFITNKTPARSASNYYRAFLNLTKKKWRRAEVNNQLAAVRK